MISQRHLGNRQLARLRALMYTLILLSSSQQVAIAPLLPEYARRYSLNGPQEGILLACAGVATLAVSIPSGALSDRFGPRRLTILAGWAMAAGCLLQAFAPSFDLLLVARLVFGAGYGIVWSAGLAWLSGTAGDKAGLRGVVTSSGVGGIAGPALAGVAAQYFGLASPLVIAAVACGVATALLGTVGIDHRLPAEVERYGLVERLGMAMSDRATVASLVAVVAAGMSSGFLALLVPVVLHGDGVTTTRIGFYFAFSSVLYIAGSSVTGALGNQVVRVRTALAAVLVLVVVMMPASISTASMAIVIMLCGAATVRSVLWSVAYPLGSAAAERTGAGMGVMMGLLNGVWAVTAIASPLVAGSLVGSVGAKGAFAACGLVCIAALGVGWVAIRPSLEESTPLALPASSGETNSHELDDLGAYLGPSTGAVPRVSG